MGYFSWLTADTNESIGVELSMYPHSIVGPIYLLQPGMEPIEEESYEGIGVFGDVDVYTWLTVMNRLDGMDRAVLSNATATVRVSDADFVQAVTKKLIGLPHDESVLVGLSDDVFARINEDLRVLALDRYSSYAYIDKRSGEVFVRGENGVPKHFEEPAERFGGKSLSDLFDEGHLTKTLVQPEFPLKFSYNPDTEYVDLPASRDCPYQGFFYPEDYDCSPVEGGDEDDDFDFSP